MTDCHVEIVRKTSDGWAPTQRVAEASISPGDTVTVEWLTTGPAPDGAFWFLVCTNGCHCLVNEATVGVDIQPRISLGVEGWLRPYRAGEKLSWRVTREA